jgi:hypothetical protein
MDTDDKAAAGLKATGGGDLESGLGDMPDPEKACLEFLIEFLKADNYVMAVKLAKWADEQLATGFDLSYEYFCWRHGGVKCQMDCDPSEFYNCELQQIPDYRYLRGASPIHEDGTGKEVVIELAEAALSKFSAKSPADGN